MKRITTISKENSFFEEKKNCHGMQSKTDILNLQMSEKWSSIAQLHTHK